VFVNLILFFISVIHIDITVDVALVVFVLFDSNVNVFDSDFYNVNVKEVEI
jgi:hypothetical protein